MLLESWYYWLLARHVTHLFPQHSDRRIRSSRAVWATKQTTEKQTTNKANVKFVKLILSNIYEKTVIKTSNIHMGTRFSVVYLYPYSCLVSLSHWWPLLHIYLHCAWYYIKVLFVYCIFNPWWIYIRLMYAFLFYKLGRYRFGVENESFQFIWLVKA